METVTYARSSIDYNPIAATNALASLVYASDTVLSIETLETWYEANKTIFWVALVNQTLVGYISVLPLCDSKFNELYQSDFDEKTIAATDILPFESASCFLLSSIVVSPDYRRDNDTRTSRSSISRVLRLNFLSDMLSYMQKSEIVSIRLAGEAITPKGESMLHSLGLHFISETRPGNKLYVGDLMTEHLIRLVEGLRCRLE